MTYWNGTVPAGGERCFFTDPEQVNCRVLFTFGELKRAYWMLLPSYVTVPLSCRRSRIVLQWSCTTI